MQTETDNKITLSQKIFEEFRVIMARKKLNYVQLAELMGTTRQKVWKIFAKENATLIDIESIANALDCNIEINFISRQNEHISQVSNKNQ